MRLLRSARNDIQVFSSQTGHKERATMTSRVPMVSLEHARELGDAMGMPARRTQSEAFRTVANNPVWPG
jgi:hypothetical protein